MPTVDDQLRGLVKVSDMDLRPALLYFHYPHDDEKKLDANGKSSLKQCGSLVDDSVARWASLFKCYEVDMGKSDRGTADKLGAGAGTSFSVVDGKLRIAGKCGPMAEAKQVVAFLKATLKSECPTYWDDLQKRVEDQKKLLDEARKLAAKKQWKESLEKYDLIRMSDFRIADFFDEAWDEAVKVEREVAQAK